MAELTIDSHYLYSIYRQASYTWKKILCELIDNSLDAGATNIRLQFPGGNVFRIIDDGRGAGDLMRMVTLGRRYEHETNDVGKYGVGCKHALLWLWGTSHIVSETTDVRHEIEMHWEDIARGKIPYPESAIALDKTGETGTVIECYAERKYPSFDGLISSLSATYSPALENGICISIDTTHHRRTTRTPLEPVLWPETTEEIIDTIEAAGRKVFIRMGIVSEGEYNPYEKGFSFERTHRVIKQSVLGANGFSVNRVAARITLSKEWELSTNKDDLLEYEDELGEAIYERCADLMERASKQTIAYEESMFNQELASQIAESMKCGPERIKEKRPNKQGGSGPVEPVKTNRKRTSAKNTSDEKGSVYDIRKRISRRGFNVDTYEDPDSMAFGFYDESANRLRLNIGNPFLAERHKEQDANSLCLIMYGILSYHQSMIDSESEPLFAVDATDYSELWGSLLANKSKAEVVS